MKGKELKLHNEYRARKSEALHQLDPVFPLRNLNNVRLGIQSENIANNSDWLFRWSEPDEPLRESDKKEYQGFIDKLYKKIVPFLEKEAIKEVPTEIILPKDDDAIIWDSDFNSEKSTLYIGKYEIKISKRENPTFGHFVLKHIFNSPEELSEEFPYKDIWEQAVNDTMKDFNARSYFRGCEEIQIKVSQGTNFAINDFLIFNSIHVRINPKYLSSK